jgi:hypothetical protein
MIVPAFLANASLPPGAPFIMSNYPRVPAAAAGARPEPCRCHTALEQGRYAEAEPLVAAGYEGLKTREAKMTAASKVLLLEAAVQVVRLYKEWGKPEQARSWATKVGLADLPADVFSKP